MKYLQQIKNNMCVLEMCFSHDGRLSATRKRVENVVSSIIVHNEKLKTETKKGNKKKVDREILGGGTGDFMQHL